MNTTNPDSKPHYKQMGKQVHVRLKLTDDKEWVLEIFRSTLSHKHPLF